MSYHQDGIRRIAELEEQKRVLKQELDALKAGAPDANGETENFGGLFENYDQVQQFVLDWLDGHLNQSEEWIAQRLCIANRILNEPDSPRSNSPDPTHMSDITN